MKMSVNEMLARVRRNYGRMFALLDGPDRGPLVMAEITHVAIHLAEHARALDLHLAEGKRLPEAWLVHKTQHPRSEDTAPTT